MTNQPSDLLDLCKDFDLLCKSITESEIAADLQKMYVWRFSHAAWAWKPIIERMSADAIDRRGEVMNGPVFTSQDYAWPEANGFPMVPIIQLNLESAGKVAGVDLGPGFVQVWIGHKLLDGKDAVIRVVPSTVVENSDMTPLPVVDGAIRSLVTPDWMDSDDESAQQIIGYEDQRFTADFGSSIKENFRALAKIDQYSSMVKKIDQSFKSLGEEWSSNFSHLFGTFQAIQYQANERGTPLFCFEGDYDTENGMDWGDGGNAQLFFIKNDDGSIEFGFDWSCY